MFDKMQWRILPFLLGLFFWSVSVNVAMAKGKRGAAHRGHAHAHRGGGHHRATRKHAAHVHTHAHHPAPNRALAHAGHRPIHPRHAVHHAFNHQHHTQVNHAAAVHYANHHGAHFQSASYAWRHYAWHQAWRNSWYHYSWSAPNWTWNRYNTAGSWSVGNFGLTYIWPRRYVLYSAPQLSPFPAGYNIANNPEAGLNTLGEVFEDKDSDKAPVTQSTTDQQDKQPPKN
jgi:hypothetical protein